MRHGFFKPALLGQGTSQIVVGFGETGVKGYRLLVIENGSLKISPLGQLDGEAIMHAE